MPGNSNKLVLLLGGRITASIVIIFNSKTRQKTMLIVNSDRHVKILERDIK